VKSISNSSSEELIFKLKLFYLSIFNSFINAEFNLILHFIPNVKNYFSLFFSISSFADYKVL